MGCESQAGELHSRIHRIWERAGQTFCTQSSWQSAEYKKLGRGQSSSSGMAQAGKGVRTVWVMCRKGNFSLRLQIGSLRKSFLTTPFPLYVTTRASCCPVSTPPSTGWEWRRCSQEALARESSASVSPTPLRSQVWGWPEAWEIP